MNNLADGWLSTMQLIFGNVHLDTTRAAKIGLKNTLEEISTSEEALNLETNDIVRRIRIIQSTGKTQPERVRPLLVQSKKIRGKLAVLAKKKYALEQHMETLINSELNQHVLSSMQKTSHALKGMGLDKSLESVDRVMMDLEENHNDLRDMQNTLGATFEQSDDMDLDLELALLLDDEAPRRKAPVHMHSPVSVNSINSPAAPPVSVQHAEVDDTPSKVEDAPSKVDDAPTTVDETPSKVEETPVKVETMAPT